MQEFDEIYRLYSAKVYGFILKLCGNTHIAEEIMQETFYKAIKSSNKFNGKCEISTWLCSIARHEYLNYAKKKDNNNLASDDLSVYEDDFNVEDMFEDKQQALQIHRAIHILPEPYKEIFTLRIMGELSFADIGKVFGKTENWARVTFFRAKEKVIRQLKEESNDEM